LKAGKTAATALAYMDVVVDLVDLVVWLTKQTTQARQRLRWNVEGENVPSYQATGKTKVGDIGVKRKSSPREQLRFQLYLQ